MAVFVYSGRTRAGQTVNGEMEAATREAVVAKLRSQQVIATNVKAKAKEISFSFGGKVTEKDIVIFTRQFATMIDAGLPLVQCLEILSTQNENATFKKALQQIRQSVEGGPRSPPPCATTRRSSPPSTPTWWRPARRGESWIPS
jgi:type IV pilus assembly protein PilC